MGFGVIIIGDEIISGRRQDRHMAKAIELLTARGLDLAWCQYLGDDTSLITSTLQRTLAGGDIVFSFGGIGATPDDLTRQCAADAAGVALERHPEALALIVEKFGDAAYPKRVLMADFPKGAEIVPNPFNRIPGFSLGRHYFLPGFPQMAWPMMEWVLDHRYAHLHHLEPRAEQAIVVMGAMESQLLDLMNDVVREFPKLKLFSLPTIGTGRRIELGVRGDPEQVTAAMERIRRGVSELGFSAQESPP
ncbi:MAG: competence/damage-inducible protein A [Betaproteobacteria bacterium]|nr:competence/damage-inducible protein A [Betaproteobacteria bacterium]